MRLAVMQPYFFPYLGYFQLIAAADKFILYDNLNYIRQGWMHRNRIRLKGNGPVYCSVPLVGAGSFVKIRDVRIDPTRRWPGKFLDQLSFNYGRAPFFNEVFSVIEQAVHRHAERLMEVNRNGIIAVAEFLGIKTLISSDSSRYEAFEASVLEPDSALIRALSEEMGTGDVKTLRLLQLCRGEGAEVYINPPGGRDLYSKDVFRRNGVALQFLEPRLSPYPQQEEPFLPGLSILDVLMHCGREGARRLLDDHTLA